MLTAIGSNSSWHAHGRALNFTTWTQSIEECESQILNATENDTAPFTDRLPSLEECKQDASLDRGKLARLWILGDPGSGTQQQRMVRDAFLRYCSRSEARRWTWDATIFLGELREHFIPTLSTLRTLNVCPCMSIGDNAYPEGTPSDYKRAFFGQYRDVLVSTPSFMTLCV